MNIMNDINGAVDGIRRKTKENLVAVKLTNEIRALKADMNKAFTEYGRACFEEKTGRSSMPSEAFFETLLSYKSRLKQLNDQLDALRAIRRCPACGAPQDDNAAFCNRCGARMPKADNATVTINLSQTSTNKPITPTEGTEEPDARNFEEE